MPLFFLVSARSERISGRSRPLRAFRNWLPGCETRSLILLFLGAAASSRATHWAATMPLLKNEETCGVDWPVMVMAGVSGLALLVSSESLSLLGPTTGTTEYCTVSPGWTE